MSIFLVVYCLTWVSCLFSRATVSPFNGTHLSLDYQLSVNITDYTQVKDVSITMLDVSIETRKNFLKFIYYITLRGKELFLKI